MKKANNELHLSITLVMSLSFLAQCIKILNNLYMNFNLVVTLPTPQLLAKDKKYLYLYKRLNTSSDAKSVTHQIPSKG